MTPIYYKTVKSSETGKKIQDLIDRGKKSVEEINKFVDELKSDRKYLLSDRCSFGTGIVALKFENEPDMKVWKNFKGFPGYYSPRMSCTEGKVLAAKIYSFHKVDRSEIGDAIGLDDFFKIPGLQCDNSEEFFGISIDKNWSHEMPEDCLEITGSEFDNL